MCNECGEAELCRYRSDHAGTQGRVKLTNEHQRLFLDEGFSRSVGLSVCLSLGLFSVVEGEVGCWFRKMERMIAVLFP